MALRLIVAVVVSVGLSGAPALAQQGPAGITTPSVLAPFDPQAAACSAPSGLGKSLLFAMDNDRDFITGAGAGLMAAAKDRGLSYAAVNAQSDAARQAEQIRAAITAKSGAVVTAPVDALALAPILQEVIWSGAYVGTIVPPPAITILNAPQYLTGRTLAEDAARHIREKFGGKADVVLLTHDSLQFLAPRFAAMRDVLSEMPEVTIVADISPATVDEAGGYHAMQTVLEAFPNVDVVLGADTVVLGALRALREAGRDRPDQYLGGIDGEPQAVTEILGGTGPYKASIALSSPIFGYALGQYAADWLEGRSVPQAMDVLPFALTKDNIAQYRADQNDPGAVFADPVRRDAYLRMYGNICADSRDQYLNFPWSSEAG
ncbi:MAG: sugar ABC transporter substrate-binding protein [Devosia sp.]